MKGGGGQFWTVKKAIPDKGRTGLGGKAEGKAVPKKDGVDEGFFTVMGGGTGVFKKMWWRTWGRRASRPCVK